MTPSNNDSSIKPLVNRFLHVSIIAVILLSIAACTASAGKKYYQLFLPLTPEQAVAPEETAPRIDKVLMIAPVQVDETYQDYRVVYRTSPYELNYYDYHFWVKKPDKLVQDVLRDYLSDSHAFRKVISNFPEGTPDLLLKANVHVIEEVDSPKIWYGHLKMDFQVRDFKTDTVILTHTFNRQMPFPARKAEHLPGVVSQILQEELDLVINELMKKN